MAELEHVETLKQGVKKTTGRGGVHGYDGAKEAGGRKRHILVDTPGLPLYAAMVRLRLRRLARSAGDV